MSKQNPKKVQRLYPNQPIIGIGAVIIKEGKILLEKRKNSPGRGKWNFVVIDYCVKVKKGVPRAASDAGELRWVPFSEVEECNLTRSFRFFFRRNRQKLEKLNSYP